MLGNTADVAYWQGRYDAVFPNFTNAILRDAVSTNMFAERYEWTENGAPYPAGQRPSIFGAGAVIDVVWMNNGVRSDRGLPAVVSLGDIPGGLAQLTLRGLTLDIAFDPAASPGGALRVGTHRRGRLRHAGRTAGRDRRPAGRGVSVRRRRW